MQEFVNAENWEDTRQVMQAQQEQLFRPEVETLFEQNIAQARFDEEEPVVRLLEVHLALLRECKASSIEEAFAKLTAAEEDEDALPFDTELITQSIAALLGSPQEKMAYMQYLASTRARQQTGSWRPFSTRFSLRYLAKTFLSSGANSKASTGKPGKRLPLALRPGV